MELISKLEKELWELSDKIYKAKNELRKLTSRLSVNQRDMLEIQVDYMVNYRDVLMNRIVDLMNQAEKKGSIEYSEPTIGVTDLFEVFDRASQNVSNNFGETNKIDLLLYDFSYEFFTELESNINYNGDKRLFDIYYEEEI